MNWEEKEIKTQNNLIVNAQAPVIISASRSTDIPAFYSKWFIERWKNGCAKWINPFNQKPTYVTFENTRCVVFWTKNPQPMMKYLDWLDENVPNYYFQFSLNDYEKEQYELKIPPLEKRIKTFKELSNRLGKERVIWRFDPLILTDKINVLELLNKIKKVGNEIHKFTEKLVFSFADISIYKKVQNNLIKEQIKYIDWTEELMKDFAKGLIELNKDWNLHLGTCSEVIDFKQYNISHNKCIDDDLMIKLFSEDNALMKFLGAEVKPANLFGDKEIIKNKKMKDKGQRNACGCVMSKDIGQYNTCPHECIYCYANTSKEYAKRNYKLYLENPNNESIINKS